MTSQLANSLLQKSFFLLCTGSGKERTDGVIDMLAVELCHQRKKQITIVCVSNDHGFDALVCLLHYRGCNVMRVACKNTSIAMKELLNKIM